MWDFVIVVMLSVLGAGQVWLSVSVKREERERAQDAQLGRSARARLAERRRECRRRKREARARVVRALLVVPKAVVILLVVLPATAVVAVGSWVRRVVVKGVGRLVWWVDEEWTTVEIVHDRIRRTAAPVAGPAVP